MISLEIQSLRVKLREKRRIMLNQVIVKSGILLGIWCLRELGLGGRERERERKRKAEKERERERVGKGFAGSQPFFEEEGKERGG